MPKFDLRNFLNQFSSRKSFSKVACARNRRRSLIREAANVETLERRTLLTVSISSATLAEPTSGQASMVFTLTRTDGLDHSIQVAYQTQDGTAKANVDYTPKAGSAFFGVGNATTTISVPVLHVAGFQGSKSFTVRLTSIVNNPPMFATGVNTTVDNSPTSIATADFNGDGSPDLVVGHNNASAISVLLNNTTAGATTPSFAAKQDLTINRPAAVAVGDFNGDGMPDIATVAAYSTQVSVFLNETSQGSSTINFLSLAQFPAGGGSPNQIAVADINGDGKPDIIEITGTVNVLINTTPNGAVTPTFAPVQSFTGSPTPESLTIGDFNGDGKPDVVCGARYGLQAAVLLNTTAANSATASFAAKLVLTTGNLIASMSTGDVNADGKTDLVVSSYNDLTVSVFTNTTAQNATTASFASPVVITTKQRPNGVTIADVTGDGRPDIVVTNQYLSNFISVFANTTTVGNATPTFAQGVDFTAAQTPVALLAADFNADSQLDLAVVNNGGKNVSVLLNQLEHLGTAVGTGTIFSPVPVTVPDGLVAWWTGDNGGADVTGHNNGTLFNGTSFAPGKVGQAFSFDGVDDRLQIPDNADLKLTQSLTIEGWVLVKAYPSVDNGEIFFRGDDRSGLDPYFLAVHPNGIVEFGVDSGSGAVGINTPVPLNQFVYVAATLDNATGAMRLYLNGVLATSTTTSFRPFGDLNPSSNPGNGVGNTGGFPATNHNFPFNGLIDELSVYNRALTTAEIQGIYNAGSAGKVEVNHAPIGTSGTVTTSVNTAYTFKAADFGFTDPNDSPPNALLAVKFTLLPNAGTITDNGMAVSVNQFVSAADINSGKLKFTPNANLTGLFFLSKFQVEDNGGTTGGGVNLDPTAKPQYVNIKPINHAPIGTTGTVAAGENRPYTFKATDFGFSDPNDAPANTLLAVKFTLLPGSGTITDNGFALIANQFVSVSEINAGKLVFTPTTNLVGLFFLAKFQVEDNGGTASGGVNLDPTAKVLYVNITHVNHAPVGKTATLTTIEDTPYVFKTSDFGFTDPSDTPANTLLAVKFTLLPTAGTITDNGVPLTVNQLVSVSDISGGKLVFKPGTHLSGLFFLSKFQVEDNGGTANGGVNLDPTAKVLYANILQINHAPVGTTNTLTIVENTLYTFKVSDFGFADPNDSPPNTFLAVKLTLLPSAGTITDNGVAVAVNQLVSASDISSGKLKFTPSTNLAGFYFLAKFQVEDSGGTANGGVNLDPTPKVLYANIHA